jgi:hypothetical protein
VEYTPLNVHFHWMWSFSSSLKLMFFIRLQSLINSTSCSLELMWRATPIHLLFHNSFSIVLYLKHASLYRFRAKSMAWIHSTIYRARITSFSRFLKILSWRPKRGLCPLHHMTGHSFPWSLIIRPVIPTPPLPEGSSKTGKVVDT